MFTINSTHKMAATKGTNFSTEPAKLIPEDSDKVKPTKVINFSAGPAKLPQEVLEKAAHEMCNYNNTGLSVMEISHRSAEFTKIIFKAKNDLRELLNVPDNYKIVFKQGGGTGQFSAVPLNLMKLKESQTADYIITGSWSAKAAKEAEKYGKVNRVLPKMDQYTSVEFQFIPETNGVPLVCDMSSNLLSRPVDVSKYGVIFAGAQKNIGCAGVTLVIIREDLLGHAIYIVGLVLQWVKEQGGVAEMNERARIKSEAVYKVIDESDGFYSAPIDPKCRSRMNVAFRVGGVNGNEELEKKFLEEADLKGLVSLKGHRSVGGMRASLYNALLVHEAMQLVQFMQEFREQNS
ncbi:hypothetical protein KUTeg_011085 [Tegillarca granosa]|uniref:phosphoserine transaminase n=1 Tax=Tegillarca granosa TaxID=220873 RepID=A0ABQ9F821_TEGGR|nr:hypothetical protein KUTeg_011085 [Tegillarca granosa]